jgi:5'-phosphate synthase pdxT subunit
VSLNIGILALQGDVAEHAEILTILDAQITNVRRESDLTDIDGLIIPGGESTAIARLLIAYELIDPIREKIIAGLPVWGTCAGAILLAKEVTNLDRPSLQLMDIRVTRNAFGSQIYSFEKQLHVEGIDGENMLATSFHPELGKDVRMHQLFLDMCVQSASSGDKYVSIER